jgi:transposase-like protein
MSVCQCPHCGSQHQIRSTGSGRVCKKQKCEACGGKFSFSSLVSGVKKFASNPMVQQAVRAVAPHAMSALQRHAPGVANVVNRGVNFARQHSGAIQSAMRDPRQFAQQQLPGLARSAAQRFAPGLASSVESAMRDPRQFAQQQLPGLASSAAQRFAPGLTSSVQRMAANPMVQRMAASPMAQSGLAALRSRVGLGRRGPRGPRARRSDGGIKLMAATKLLGAIPGVSDALGNIPIIGDLFGGPRQPPPPPPPPRASFQGIQGFQAPRMFARVGVRGRGTRPPTKHALAVGEVMRTMGMALPQASRYVKEKGLAM